MLYFQPSTGLSVRVDSPETELCRRAAPRVVLFALSHACNLRCSFCSRDETVTARWNADDAFELLSSLEQRGTLEVAFGGGEPLAYAGFPEFVARLGQHTRLAIHLTTNGELVDATTCAALAPHVGEVRVSIYQAGDWMGAIEHLRRAQIQASANILVTPENLPVLPVLLRQLTDLGCHNVALLRYVGDDAKWSLGPADFHHLEQCIALSPLPVRLSHCFADRMPDVPRLFSQTGDCGAGRDFLVINPDRTFSACSFHPASHGFLDGRELVGLLDHNREALASDVEVEGCARPFLFAEGLPNGVRVYRGFSSNNSGDTVLVARFDTVTAPRELVELLATLSPETEPQTWQEMLRKEGLDIALMDYDLSVAAVGKVIMATAYDAADALPVTRALAEKRDGTVVHTGVHVHESPTLLVGLSSSIDSKPDEHRSKKTLAALADAGAAEVERKGTADFAVFQQTQDTSWTEALAKAEEVAAQDGSRIAAELVDSESGGRLVDACKQTLDGHNFGYYGAMFHRSEHAARFVSACKGGRVTQAGSFVLVDTVRVRSYLPHRAREAGGVGFWLPKDTLHVSASFYFAYPRKGSVTPSQVVQAVKHTTGTPLKYEAKAWGRNVLVSVSTSEPHRALTELERAAKHLDVNLHVGVRASRPLAHALDRVQKDLVVLRD